MTLWYLTGENFEIQMSSFQYLHMKNYLWEKPFWSRVEIGIPTFAVFTVSNAAQYRLYGPCLSTVDSKNTSEELIKGIFHQFWIYRIFFVSQQKKHFLWKVFSIKQLLTWNNWEKLCSKSVPVIIISITLNIINIIHFLL